MLRIVASNRFKKDLKLASKRGLNLDLLRQVIDTLAAEEPFIAYEKKDHHGTLRSESAVGKAFPWRGRCLDPISREGQDG